MITLILSHSPRLLTQPEFIVFLVNLNISNNGKVTAVGPKLRSQYNMGWFQHHHHQYSKKIAFGTLPNEAVKVNFFLFDEEILKKH